MLLSHQYPNQMSHLVIALLIAWGGTFIILLQSSLFLRLLGEKGVNALERLMGLILVMMATQMFLDGIRAWMKGVAKFPSPVGEGRGEGIRPQRTDHLPLTNQIPVRQRFGLLRHQLMLHKGTKPGISRVVAGSSAIISSVSPAACTHGLRTIITGSGQRRPWASRVWSGLENRSVMVFSVKNGCSLRPVAPMQTRLTIAQKQPLQCPAKAVSCCGFYWVPSPQRIKRSQYDAFSESQRVKALFWLSLFHLLVITSSNYLVQLPISIFGFHTTWGAFSFPFIFLATDLTVRIFGAPLARRIIFAVMVPALFISYGFRPCFIWEAGRALRR
jgi:hypothetical protein